MSRLAEIMFFCSLSTLLCEVVWNKILETPTFAYVSGRMPSLMTSNSIFLESCYCNLVEVRCLLVAQLQCVVVWREMVPCRAVYAYSSPVSDTCPSHVGRRVSGDPFVVQERNVSVGSSNLKTCCGWVGCCRFWLRVRVGSCGSGLFDCVLCALTKLHLPVR
jgi:hypothetical protein